MGFGSYETAWTWAHKPRSAMVRSDSEPMGPFVQTDEALVGGKGGPHKELVLVAAEANGRVRLAHVVTNGHAGYTAKSLGERTHDAVVQTKAERKANDAVQACHRTISLLKRWLMATNAGAVRDKHLQAYLNEFASRHNRRKTSGVCRIAARLIQRLVVKPDHAQARRRHLTLPLVWLSSAGDGLS